MDSSRINPEDQSSSSSSGEESIRTLYADVVKGHSPLTNDYWRRFQMEDEDEAMRKALKESLLSTLTKVGYSFWQLFFSLSSQQVDNWIENWNFLLTF